MWVSVWVLAQILWICKERRNETHLTWNDGDGDHRLRALKKPSAILLQIWGKLSLLATFENGFCLKTTAEFDDDLKNNPNYIPDFQNFPVCLNYALKEKLGKNPLCSFIYLFAKYILLQWNSSVKEKVLLDLTCGFHSCVNK